MPRLLRTGFTLLLSAVVFTMMTITSVDVAGRYLLNMPLPGTQEMTELLLALLVFGAAPLVSADRTHITTDILESSIKGGLRTMRDISVGIVSCLACAVLAWRIWVQAASMSALSGHTPLLGIPVGPLLYFCAVMCFACAVLSLAQAGSASFRAWRT